MNESLRWKLVLGCLMIAVLEAPRTSLVLAEDLGGPYSTGIEAARREAALDAASRSDVARVAEPGVRGEEHELVYEPDARDDALARRR